ncbi:molecular chaperone DnaJ [Spiroplasma endosymbiont of Anurida maritima]|uniref:molecular chaperone DnaJ n=1 Tax=Spiroplasma endosymbiont of Anurida maritima TaxID=2967972 RepID=UPI0036D3B36C
MSNKRDYYEVLGISKSATQAEIKAAFRTLAKKYHPDISKEENAEDKFKEINEAYEVLSNEEKRSAYDKFGHAGMNGQGGFGGFEGFSGFGGFEDIFSGGFGDIFDNFFGGSRRGGGQKSTNGYPTKGADIGAVIDITLKEMMFGVDKSIEIKIDSVCDTCDGIGAKSASDVETCSECKGQGFVIEQKRSLFGIVQQQVKCHHCKGRGKIIKVKCTDCKGSARKLITEEIEFQIPKTILPNQQIRLRNKGHHGFNKGPRGDIYLEVRVQESKYFERHEHDLLLDLEVPYLDLILGTDLEIPTFDGIVKVKVAPNTKNNTNLKIANHGFFKGFINRRGDMFVNLIAKMPKKLSTEEKSLLQKLKKQSKDKIADDYLDNL